MKAARTRTNERVGEAAEDIEVNEEGKRLRRYVQKRIGTSFAILFAGGGTRLCTRTALALAGDRQARNREKKEKEESGPRGSLQ